MNGLCWAKYRLVRHPLNCVVDVIVVQVDHGDDEFMQRDKGFIKFYNFIRQSVVLI